MQARGDARANRDVDAWANRTMRQCEPPTEREALAGSPRSARACNRALRLELRGASDVRTQGIMVARTVATSTPTDGRPYPHAPERLPTRRPAPRSTKIMFRFYSRSGGLAGHGGGRRRNLSERPLVVSGCEREVESGQGGRHASFLGNAFFAICAEAGNPALTLGDGAPLPCGDTRVIDEVTLHPGARGARQGNLPAAFSLASRLAEDRPGCAAWSISTKRLNGVGLRARRKVRALQALPVAWNVAPLWF